MPWPFSWRTFVTSIDAGRPCRRRQPWPSQSLQPVELASPVGRNDRGARLVPLAPASRRIEHASVVKSWARLDGLIHRTNAGPLWMSKFA
jgi:hypothetical protein